MTNTFIQNKYTNWYYRIIDQAKSRMSSGYTESHHIIPKSMGGSDAKDNKVSLTAREHFVVHKLLIKMTSGKNRSKMSFAFISFFMKSRFHKARNDLRFSSRDYEARKRLLSEEASKLHKGKEVSKETIQKMLESRRRNNKPYPDSSRDIQRQHTKNRWTSNYELMVSPLKSEESRKKISMANKGIDRLSKEQRQELAERNSGSGNGRAREIKVTAPDGTVYLCYGNFHNFCKDHNLPFSTMCHILHKTRVFATGRTVGWLADFNEAPQT